MTTGEVPYAVVPWPRRPPSPQPRPRPEPAAPAPAPSGTAPTLAWRRAATQTALALALGVVVGLTIAVLVTPSPPPPALAPSTAAAPGAPITVLGQVSAVRDGQTVTVQVGDRDLDVTVLGLDAPRPGAPGGPVPCGSQAATALATSTLVNQPVTLVPDPAVRSVDDSGHRRAYVVLRTQLSYTDLALQRGVARRSTEPLSYSDVFAGEENAARAARVGLWGPPCRETR